MHEAVIDASECLSILEAVTNFWTEGNCTAVSTKLPPLIKYLMCLTEAMGKRQEGAASDMTTVLTWH
jgi:hypothetical protein